jgi:hypothetical protein
VDGLTKVRGLNQSCVLGPAPTRSLLLSLGRPDLRVAVTGPARLLHDCARPTRGPPLLHADGPTDQEPK